MLNSKAPIAEILFMEQLGEIGQRVQMLLELALRHQKRIRLTNHITLGMCRVVGTDTRRN